MNHIDIKELNEWISLINELDDMQKLTLIGLLDKFPDLNPNTIIIDRIIGEEKVSRTLFILKGNLRKALRFCCRLKSQQINSDDFLSHLITYLMGSSAGLSLGASAGFAIWLLGYSTNQCCEKYCPQSYDGTGEWAGLNMGVITINGVYNLTYNPGISTIVRTKQLNLRFSKLKLDESFTIEGVFSSGHYIPGNKNAYVEFTDVRNNCVVSGTAEGVKDRGRNKIFSGRNFKKVDLSTNVTTQLN